MNTSDPAVDFETWHLLTSGCNSSKSSAFWIDVGWPQGSVTDDQLQCLRKVGFKFITFECWLERNGGIFWQPCVDNIFRAQAAGFPVGVYMFPWRAADPSVQVSQLIGNLTVRYFLNFSPLASPSWSFHSIFPIHILLIAYCKQFRYLILEIRLLVFEASSKLCSILKVQLGIIHSLKIEITFWRSAVQWKNLVWMSPFIARSGWNFSARNSQLFVMSPWYMR